MEMSSGTAALTVFLLFLVPLLMILVPSMRASSRSKKQRPPGPWAFPLVGSIHHMLTSQPQVALRDLAARHGAVMLLRLGQVDTVVVSSPAAAQDVLQHHDLCFASRPSLATAKVICYDNLDLAFAPYGDYWRALRKLCVLELLSARKVRQLAPIRDGETMSLVAQIRASAASGGGEDGDAAGVNLGRLLEWCSNSITGLATFGDGCSGERREQFLSAVAVVLSHASCFCVSDLFPLLSFVDVLTGTRSRLWTAHRQLDALFDIIIGECEARWKKDDECAAAAAGDDNLLSIMLRVRNNQEFAFPFTNTNIKAIIVDLFVAGTETISSTAEWVMSELTRHPDAMAKAQAEVRAAFTNIAPQQHEAHIDALHYMRMVIMETLRLHPSVPLLLPRVCRETCDVGGFEVTQGCRVLINAWAIGRSPEHWGSDADEFRPTRFEDSDDSFKGGGASKFQFHYLPFGGGRRMCPGSAFAMATLELVVARLLYYFDWSLPGKMRPEELDMETFVGATARRRNQLHLVATPRDDFPVKI